ncbi:MAG: polysaccharide deacetylase family protein, partial [Planctomycetaceae bacterium]|nr:polysaccharide deacetylase family protein [Planctomycetaceae bacterium]
LKKAGELISLHQIEEVLNSPGGRGILITFDDGYRDNYELALPVLERHGASAVFFITTGFLDDGQVAWWDELSWMVQSTSARSVPPGEYVEREITLEGPSRALALRELLQIHKQIPWDRTIAFRDELGKVLGTGRCPKSVADGVWMTWDMVREMHERGMEIGGHTVNHPVLANLELERQRHEIFDSKRRIESELGREITAFSYPVGQRDSFTEETEQILREAGYRYSFSFYGGFASKPAVNRFDLPRIAIESGTEGAMFRSMVTLPQVFGT